MADLLPPVVAVLVAQTAGFSSGMEKAVSDMGRVETAAGKMASVGKAAFLGMSVAAVAIGTESVKMAANFDQAMELIHTQAGASQAEVEQLKNQVLALAPTVGIGPEKLAEGLYHVESAGFRGKEAVDIVTAAAKDAAIGMGDLDSVSQALIGTMSSGIGGIKDAADAAAMLNTTVGIGDMRMEKLAAAISTGVLPSFKSAGLSMQDFSASLATLTDNATPADEAATRLRMTVALMAAPSGKAVDALKKIGLSGTQLAEDMRKPNGLLVAVMDLKKHLEESGMSAVEQNQVIEHAFGGGKTSGAILTLIEESDRLQSKYAALGTSSSRAAQMQDAWASQQKQFSQQMHQLGAEAQVIAIHIGNMLIPVLQKLGSWLAGHIGFVKILAVVIGSVLVTAMAAWTAAVIANTVAMLANPTTWIILAIVAAVALLAVGIYELVTHWKTVWGFIKRIAMDVWHWLVDAWHATIHALETAAKWVKTNVIDPIVHWFKTYLLGPIKEDIKIWTDIWKFAWGFASVIFGDFMKVVQVIWGLLKTTIIDPAKTLLLDFWHWIDTEFVQPVERLFNLWLKSVEIEWHYFLVVINTVKGWLLDFWHWVDNEIIHPIESGFDWLASQWSRLWNGIKSVLHAVWSDMKPIFDTINSAIHTVTSALHAVAADPTGAGKMLANMMHFDQGGWVPGATGEPQLAVVHGGEYVLSNDMLRSMQAGSGSSRYPFAGGAVAAPAASQTGYVPIVVNLGGTQMARLHAELIPTAQRYKLRTGSTGLT